MKEASDIIEEYGYPSCHSCGAEFTEEEDIDSLVYSRTTVNGDHYICHVCNQEGIELSSY